MTDKSTGHVCFDESGTRELILQGDDLYIAPVHNAFDVHTGNRIGRWEGPNCDSYRAYLAEYCGFPAIATAPTA